MKTHRRILLACCLFWLGTSSSAWCFYNPTTGRWLNRDPIGEAGGKSLYGSFENDPPNEVDVFGLECFCCCADSVQIENVKNYDDNPRFGHSFDVRIKMSYPKCEKEVQAKCKLRWWEKSNRMYGGLENGKWHLMSKILEGRSNTLKPWEEQKYKQAEVVMSDNPFSDVSRGPARHLYIYIVVESEAGCKCSKQKVWTTFAQVIDGDFNHGATTRKYYIDQLPSGEWKTLPESLPAPPQPPGTPGTPPRK